jgi:hypothetical protein
MSISDIATVVPTIKIVLYQQYKINPPNKGQNDTLKKESL